MTEQDCYAVPGSGSIIDAIDPVTGLTSVNGHTFEQVRERYPRAERMSLDAFCEAKAARQSTPIVWTPCGAKEYADMLNVLYPAFWEKGLFLVGEPSDHCARTGRPRFQAYRQRGARRFRASRPMTIREAQEFLNAHA